MYTCCSIKLQKISRKDVSLRSVLLDYCSHKFLTCNLTEFLKKYKYYQYTCANGKAMCHCRPHSKICRAGTRLKYLWTSASMHERIWISLVVWSFVSIEFKIMAIFLMRHREVYRVTLILFKNLRIIIPRTNRNPTVGLI